ncbi:hypothetical protein ALPO108162_17535 [Alicyclobacillus pomorum]
MLLYGLEEDQDFQFLNRRQRTDIGPNRYTRLSSFRCNLSLGGRLERQIKASI